MKPEIEEFAKLLVRHVRDEAIRGSDVSLRSESRGPIALRWKAAGVKNAESVIPDVVDNAIFYLLSAIDHGLIRLEFVSSNGSRVDLCEEGLSELGGWYMGSDSFRARYSEERFNDDAVGLDFG